MKTITTTTRPAADAEGWGYRAGRDDAAAGRPQASAFKPGGPAAAGYARGYEDQRAEMAAEGHQIGAGFCAEHSRRDCPTCYPQPEWTPEDFKAADRRFRDLYREAQADTIRRSGWYATAWERAGS